MTVPPHKRIDALLATNADVQRVKQAVTAGMPDVVERLLPVVRGHPVVVDTAKGSVRYWVRPVRWTTDGSIFDSDAVDFSFDVRPPKYEGTVVAEALCRNHVVLTSPSPRHELVQVRAIHSPFTVGDIEDEGIDPSWWQPEPINDITLAASAADWENVALELHALLALLEQRLGHLSRTYESAHQRVRQLLAEPE